ncbi:hypothetical protein AB5J62_40920 [Amycolatopsis sp. cg5]|uniref:hypothetical protein n=1 Tax=Amycolatopsis sp. cg5 TaxID=3238802 RepID=UPI0035256410
MTQPVSTTRRTLILLGAGLLVLAVITFAGSLAAFLGTKSAVAEVRSKSAPAVLEVLAARSALVQADTAAMTSFQTGGAELIGPGELYQSQLALAGQSLAQVAEHNVAGAQGSRTLQLVEGLVSVYSGSIARAAVAFRSSLGATDLWEGSRLMHSPGSGILAQLDTLVAVQRAALAQQDSTGWLDGLSPLWWLVPAAMLFVLILCTQWYLARRFRRRINFSLLAATLLLVLACVGMSQTFGAQRQVDAAVAELDTVTTQWQTQTARIAASGRVSLGAIFRERCGLKCGPTVRAAALPTSAGPAPTAAERGPAGTKLVNDHLAAAELDEPLGYLGLACLPAMALLIIIGLGRRLDEYWYRPA